MLAAMRMTKNKFFSTHLAPSQPAPNHPSAMDRRWIAEDSTPFNRHETKRSLPHYKSGKSDFLKAVATDRN